jgi:hypothetical protein
MSRAAAGAGRRGPSSGRSLRLVAYCTAVIVGGGAPALFGGLQALWAPERPVRLALLLAWATRGTLFDAGAAVLRPVRGPLILALLAIAAVLLAQLLARLLAARRTAARRPTAVAGRSAGVGMAGVGESGGVGVGGSGVGGTGVGTGTGTGVGVGGVGGVEVGGAGGGGGAGVHGVDLSAPVVLVGAVTGTIGRAWLAGRLWTVRGGGERLREGDFYVVLARRGDVLEVINSS